MSLGPGILQRSILKGVDKAGGFIFENKLEWQLAEKFEKIEVESKIHQSVYQNGMISKSFDNSFRRAIRSLIKDDKLKLINKKLSSLEEFRALYPYKTANYQLFLLRRKFVPIIVDYITRNSSSMFSLKQIEDHIAEVMQEEDPNKFDSFVRQWKDFERSIFGLKFDFDDNSRKVIVWLLSRGRELFFKSKEVQCKRPLSAIITEGKKYLANNLYGRIIVYDISSFYDNFFESDKLKFTSLKSQLYSVAYFGKYGRPQLKKEIKVFLRSFYKDEVVCLPGHIDVETKIKGRSLCLPLELCTFSPMLDKVLDRHAFSDFKFLLSD